jgi:hypothetical protein
LLGEGNFRNLGKCLTHAHMEVIDYARWFEHAGRLGRWAEGSGMGFWCGVDEKDGFGWNAVLVTFFG